MSAIKSYGVRLAVPLIFVNLLALLVRAVWDDAGSLVKPYMATYYSEQVAALAHLPWWRFLLPFNEFDGRWGPTGFLLVNLLESWLGEPTVFYMLNAIMITTGYLVSYLVFRSFLLSFLVGVALATTTFNHHVYVVSGSVIMPLLMSFLFIFAFAQVQFIGAKSKQWLWFLLSCVSCVLFALAYEGWLDFAPLAWVIFPVLAWQYQKREDADRRNRCVALLTMTTVVALTYIAVKAAFGLGGLHPRGGEADLVVTYGHKYIILAIEDLVSSFFTFFYTTVSTYLPPWLFSFSNSLWKFGPEKVVALQEGYHPQASHLVLYNHLFLWRFYAGFALAFFLMWYWKSFRLLNRDFNRHSIIVFVLLSCIVVGSPTHLIIKWRPMHAAPFLGYQTYLAIMGFTLLLCYLPVWVSRRWGKRHSAVLAAVLAMNFIYCAYARPGLLSVMSQQSFLGAYPDPRVNMKKWLSESPLP